MSATFAFYIAQGTLSNQLIRSATGYQESHVEHLMISQVKSSNLCISASKRDGKKVRAKAIAWTPESWIFVTLPEFDGRGCMRRMWKHMGEPYDVFGAALSVTPVSRGREGRWFCSELMALGVGLDDPHQYTPGSFRRALVDMGGLENRHPDFRNA